MMPLKLGGNNGKKVNHMFRNKFTRHYKFIVYKFQFLASADNF